ncbi:dermonecrotic toxin domain-containing protein [Pseudomonas sp. KCJK9111]|uniref:dermonecrotic toxin domain-containing protein n=1 Tax=Pseudomonas sp. KCJK9111 TaxID=3344555 RepID=UPI0039069B68
MSSALPPPPAHDLNRAIALRFASRPTLRQVVGEQLMNLIIAHYPKVAVHRPDMKCAEPLKFLRWHVDGYWTVTPLVDVVLQRFLDGEPVDFSSQDRFSLKPPLRFFAIPDALETADDDLVDPGTLNDAFNAFLPTLPACFEQAQIDYWNAGYGNDHDTWVQQVLRAGLLSGLTDQALTTDEHQCLQDLLLERTEGLAVHTVCVHWRLGEDSTRELLPGLLVSASSKVAKVTLWCTSAGDVKGFPSLDAFGTYLQTQYRPTQKDDGFSWALYEADGNAFALLSGVLLEILLSRLNRVRLSDLNTVDELASAYQAVVDPSPFFAQWADLPTQKLAIELPEKLLNADFNGQSRYLQALIDVAVLQASQANAQPLTEPDDLQTYARRTLREQMMADHPADGAFDADDMILTVNTYANDGHGMGFGQLIERKTLTLTEYAIGRLEATGASPVAAVAHRTHEEIPAWLDPEYLRQLVATVDIGGNYPRYLDGLLGDEQYKATHLNAFAAQWRMGLMLDAAYALCTGHIDPSSYAAVASFCRVPASNEQALAIAPLAFKRSPDSQWVDKAHGFFVIQVADSGELLLYCPMHKGALKQFKNRQALMQEIAQPGRVQEGVLAWLDQTHRAVYDNGGFKEPHLPHWVFAPYAPLDKPAPVELALPFWTHDIDANLFEAKRSMLLELADRSAMSNSEVRWQSIKTFAWQLLNIAAPVLPGPISSIALLYIGISAVAEDLKLLLEGSATDRTQAVVDLLNNTLMVLIHAQLPKTEPTHTGATALTVDAASVRLGGDTDPLPLPEPGSVAPVEALQAQAATQLDFSWRGAQGFNALPGAPRTRLQAMAALVSLEGRPAIGQGPLAGLYELEHGLYVRLQGQVYAVESADGLTRIVGPDGSQGPLIRRDEQDWRIDTRLRGGGDRPGSSTRQRLRERLVIRIQTALQAVEQSLANADRGAAEYESLRQRIEAARAQWLKVEERLKQPPPQDPEQHAQFERATSLFAKRQTELLVQIKDLRRQRIESAVGIFQNYLEAERNIVALLDDRSYMASNNHAPEQRRALADVRRNLICYAQFIIEEQLYTGRFAEYDRLTTALNDASPQERQAAYEQYREVLESIVIDQPLIIEYTAALDRLLAVTDLEMTVPSIQKTDRTVAQIIETRTTTTPNIRFFQAMGLVELALRFEALQDYSHYAVFRAALAGERLRVAANSHHLSMFADLQTAQRIDILQSAWDEYSAAILNSQRIAQLGSELVDIERLEAYRQQMVELKTMAGDALVTALREQAVGQQHSTTRPVYPRQALQVATTANGQTVIGSESIVEGQPVLQVRGTFSKTVLHTFTRESGTWVEKLPAAGTASPPRAPTPESERQEQALAEGMLAQNQNVLANARKLVEDDVDSHSLTSMLDAQIGEVQTLRDQIADSEAEPELLQRLDDALVALRDGKREVLVKLHSTTRFPSAEGLHYLHKQGLLRVTYQGPRQPLAEGYMDEYRIDVLETPGSERGKPLWAAHFHFNDAGAAPTAFGKGHLKLWPQRKLGYREQVRSAARGEELRIHRGNLTYAQARGVIPFH